SAVLLLLLPLLLPAEVAWPVSSPEQQGFDKAKLDAVRDQLAAHATQAFLVARNGSLVYEWYAPGRDRNQKHYTASLAKSLVGGMSLLLAMQDRRISPDDPAWKYIPAWKNDPEKSRITIRHLATHSSGIQDAHQEGVSHEDLPGWMGEFWKRKPDPFTISLYRAPVLFPPGSRYHYSNTGMAALAYAVTASLRGAPEDDIKTLLASRIYGPLGIPASDWSIGYGEVTALDGLKLYANWGGGGFTPRAAARVGQLLVQEGMWEGRRLAASEWVGRMVAYGGSAAPDRVKEEPRALSGLCWHINTDGFWQGVPRDGFAGLGAGDQTLLVVPSLKLVVVRNGGDLKVDRARILFRPVVEALASGASKAPYPPSPVIRKITFDPESSIVRKAIGSDNWPLTWAGDGDLYTSYGDGFGFEPFIKPKLSMGIAKVTGPPAAFQGINIRSDSIERKGDGPKGLKASGILMVDGVLYMWVRNAGNSQLAWSADRGANWSWGFRFDQSFGSPAFLNFGRNYEGAPDGYVYTYSQDGPSAYQVDDGIVLARSPKDRIRDRGAYEFFVKLDADRQPVWTKEIARRGQVFSYPTGCQRLDVVYNPGIRRYLMALSSGHEGAWGIFDAPAPWGPWTTAFHTAAWGLGGTHGYRLPSKWISPDGRTMWLVFSGVKPNDAFCVRRFTLE
ncbi:MAG TPA: serine hydrolase, partial [Bryobacteraceae bacterium]|nr:serine hydrolase [Bryobacteraceae bacterium]